MNKDSFFFEDTIREIKDTDNGKISTVLKFAYSIDKINETIDRILDSLDNKMSRLNEIESRQLLHGESIITIKSLLEKQDKKIEILQINFEALNIKVAEKHGFKNGLLFLIKSKVFWGFFLMLLVCAHQQYDLLKIYSSFKTMGIFP